MAQNWQPETGGRSYCALYDVHSVIQRCIDQLVMAAIHPD